MVAVAFLLRWRRFAASLCLAFFGITRPGEVLRANRHDLVLPMDLLLPENEICYLRVGEPKPRRRGKGRTQHATVKNPVVVAMLSAVFGEIRSDQMLYPISPGSFWRRGDFILKPLQIPVELKLTPGSLRGGGAIEAYRAVIDLTKLCWLMRLKNLKEVAADSFLVNLSTTARERVRNFSAMFEPCLAGATAPRAPV